MQKRKIRSAEQRTQTICLLVLSAIAIGVALMQLRQVLLPFVLALFLTLAVTPVLDLLHTRLKLPRGLAIASTIALTSGALLLMGVLVSTAISEVLAKDTVYVEQVSGLLAAAERKLVDLGDLKAKLPGMVAQAIGWTVNSAMALLSQGLLVLIFMMFLISGYRAPDQRDPSSLRFQVRAQVKEYLRIKIAVSAITGVGTFAVLHSLGVDLALVFALMAFFLNFIPNIGSAVAVLLPLPIIVLAPEQDLGLSAKLLALGLPACVQFLVGNVLEPRWLGKSLDLNPVVVLLALIFWGVLWGPVGMLLSVPITAVLKMLLERSDLTRPVADLLADDA